MCRHGPPPSQGRQPRWHRPGSRPVWTHWLNSTMNLLLDNIRWALNLQVVSSWDACGFLMGNVYAVWCEYNYFRMCSAYMYCIYLHVSVCVCVCVFVHVVDACVFICMHVCVCITYV